MIHIGNHLSCSKGFAAMGRAALGLGGDTFAFFTRNPRGGAAKEIRAEDVSELLRILEENRFGKLVAHAPYTMNVCAADPRVLEFSLQTLEDDLRRMEHLPGNYYNFHPGSHVGQGTEEGIAKIADALNRFVKPDQAVTVLLETMAGKGSEVGGRFEELAAILEKANCPERLGVCLDTCHVWDAGYDIADDLDGVLAEFDRVIGLEKLCAVHLNDSKNERGSKKDRHEKLGEGRIGAEALRRFVRHPALQGKPFILETPNEDEGYRKEIAQVRAWMEE